MFMIFIMDNIQMKQAMIVDDVKRAFRKAIKEDPMESLYMVDAIQRFGIEYHFEEQIEEALQKQLLIFSSPSGDCTEDHQLYEVMLQFRLLRQGGHYVHAEALDKLKNSGKLKESYKEDLKLLIAMYEASQLSIEGEDSLDFAGSLSSKLLQEWLSEHDEDHLQARVVATTLEYRVHQSTSRFTNRSILYDLKDKNVLASLEELAEIDSWIVGSINRNEIIEVLKWWRGLGMATEMRFASYQPTKWYIWPMACFTDPRFSDERIQLTKPIALVYIIDDIFDVYGTMEELTLFTKAFNRWELEDSKKLPDYMKTCFKVVDEIVNALARKVHSKHGFNPIDTLKNSWVRLLNSFLLEAKWLKSENLPKAEEYLKNGIVSTGVHVVLVHAFFLLNQNISKETVALIHDIQGIIYSTAKILRLCDDLEGAKSADQNGVDGSYLECYVREHQSISAEEAQSHVGNLISSEWKSLNQEMLTPNPLPSSFKKFCLNAAKMVPLMYSYRSNQSQSLLKEHLKSLLNVANNSGHTM